MQGFYMIRLLRPLQETAAEHPSPDKVNPLEEISKISHGSGRQPLSEPVKYRLD
jgi:hypothetical protein